MSKELVRLRKKLRNMDILKFRNLCSRAGEQFPHFLAIDIGYFALSILVRGMRETSNWEQENYGEEEKFQLILQDEIIYPSLEKYESPRLNLYHSISSRICDRFNKSKVQANAFIYCGYKVATTWLMAFEEGKGEAFGFLLVDAFGLYTHGRGIKSSLREIESMNLSIQKKGGAARKAKYAMLERFAVSLWLQGNFRSRRQAAKALLHHVNDFARSNGITPLSEDSGTDTIYRYLLKN